jgi:predicted transcriptional regulator
MSVTIQLSPEVEARLRQKAAQHGQSPEVYVQQIVEASLGPAIPARQMTTEEWLAEFRAWVASHADWPGEFDDSRESIYEGRGE